MYTNSLTELPTEIGGLTGLRDLNLGYNSLTELPTEIGLMTALVYLSLTGNYLKELPTEIGNCAKLNWLYLHDNYLTILPKEMSKLTKLAVNPNGNSGGNFFDCAFMARYLPNSDFCFYMTTCAKADGCANNLPICETVDGKCAIKCGEEHYRDGDYCYFCPDDAPDCVKCNKKGNCAICPQGSAPSGKTCVPCTDNTFTDGTMQCQNGPENCVECDHVSGKCKVCKPGYMPDSAGECGECANGSWNSDGVTCLPSSDVTNCVKFHTTRDMCVQCQEGLLVSHDNICRTCVDGEYISGNVCEICSEGTFSLAGAYECSDDCGMFGESDNMCLETGFCETFLGMCVQKDGNTQTIFWAVIGGSIGFLVIVIVVCVFIIRSGACQKMRRKKLDRKIEMIEAATFGKCTVNADFEPKAITFKGQMAGMNERLTETLTVWNTCKRTIEVVVMLPMGKAFEMKVHPKYEIIGPKQKADFSVSFVRVINEDVNAIVSLSVCKKGRKDDGTVLSVPVVMAARPAFTITLDELSFDKKIGEGSFGIVYRGRYGNTPVAIKELKNVNEEGKEEFYKEVDVLKQVSGTNIVKFYGYVEGARMCMVSELMDLGGLDSVVTKYKPPMVMKIKMLVDVANGMDTIHSLSMMHRDLKAENVLCKSPMTLNNDEFCKITDFGTSRAVNMMLSMTLTKGQGTPLYMAPEVLAGTTHYTNSVDVYSFGVMMWSILRDGEVPYQSLNFTNQLELQNAIIEGMRPELDPQWSENLRALIAACWSNIPDERPTFKDILERLRAE